MAPEATKWSNLNLQTLFGACLCVKTHRFGVGKFGLMIAPPPNLNRVNHIELLLVLDQSYGVISNDGHDGVSGLACWGDDFISDRQVPDQ